MARLLKWLAGIAGGLTLLAGLAIAAITLWIDPDSFKPEMEAAAKKQGVILALKGDLAWQFFPDLGIVINDVAVAPSTEPQTPLAIIKHAALSVQVMPLFYGSVKVDGVVLDGADINLHVNSEGVANWSQLMTKDETPVQDEPGSESGKLAVSVHELAISNSQVSYKDDQSGESVLLSGFSLNGTDIALDGKPFALAMAGKFRKTDALQQQQSGQFDIKTSLALDEAITVVSLHDAVISLALTTAEQQQDIAMTVQVTVQLPAGEQPAVIESLHVTNGEISSTDNATKQTVQISRLAMEAKNIRIENAPSSAISVGEWLLHSADVSLVDNAIKKTTAVSNVVMKAQNITFNNQPFPLSLAATIAITQPETAPMNAKVKMSGKVAVDDTKTRIALSGTDLVVTAGTDTLQETLHILLDMAVITEPLSYQGSVDIATFNASRLLKVLGTELPPMQSPTALGKVSLKAGVSGADNTVRLHNMVMQMDETAFTGSVAITDIGKNTLDVKLRGDQMNADNYLEPVAEVTAAQPAASSDDNAEIIPVETLRGLDMDVDVAFDKLTIKALPLTRFSTLLAAHGGLVQVKHFKAGLYDKPLQVMATVDARNDIPAISFDINGSDLPVGQLLRDFAIQEHVSGNSDIKAAGTTSGIRKQELIKGLNATVAMTGKQFQVAEINIEQTVCEFIATAEQKTLVPQAWDNFTKMREMSTRMTIVNGVAKIESLQAGVEKIALSSNGKVDLAAGKFDMHLTTRITDAIVNGGPSCEVRNKKLLNRDIPIRCKGSFADIGIKTCLPDMSVLEDIVKDEAKARVDAEVEEAKVKASEKANAEVEKALKKKLGEDGSKSAKDLLKGLLKK